MHPVLALEPRPRRPLRVVLLPAALAVLLIWLTPLPPTILFWFGVGILPPLALLQIVAALLYLRLMPACYARMTDVGAKGLAAYLQQRLEKAYGSLLDDTRLVLLLTALNLVVALAILYDTRFVPTFLWAWLAVVAFASALFVLTIVVTSSRIILQMFDLLMRRSR